MQDVEEWQLSRADLRPPPPEMQHTPGLPSPGHPSPAEPSAASLNISLSLD